MNTKNILHLKKRLTNFYSYWTSTFSSTMIWFDYYKGRSKDSQISEYFLDDYIFIIKNIYIPLKNKTPKKIEISPIFIQLIQDKHLFQILITFMDQVPRHIFRNLCDAYKYDNTNLKLLKLYIKHYSFKYIDLNIQHFIYTTFTHSIDIKDHEYIERILLNKLNYNRTIKNKKQISILTKHINELRNHSKVVKRFNDYPLRKKNCNKKLSNEEIEYIKLKIQLNKNY